MLAPRFIHYSTYLFLEKSTLKEKKTMVLTSNIACSSEEKISEPDSRKKPASICTTNSPGCSSIENSLMVQSLYQLQPHAPLHDNCSYISSVSPVKPSPVKVPSKIMESFQCNTNDDVCAQAPVRSPLSNDKCPVVSDQTSSTTKSLPSSKNPLAVLSIRFSMQI